MLIDRDTKPVMTACRLSVLAAAAAVLMMAIKLYTDYEHFGNVAILVLRCSGAVLLHLF